MNGLPEDLECAVIGALLNQKVTVDQINPTVLSKIGKFIVEGYTKFEKPPIVGDILGLIKTTDSIDEGSYIQYLKDAQKYAASSNIIGILNEWQNKQLLLQLQNETLKQMREGFNEASFTKIFTEHRGTVSKDNLRSLSDLVTDEPLDPPMGVEISSLPTLNSTIGGIQNLIAVGGGPGVGKTTFVSQLMVDWLRKGKKVLYYDFENSGRELIRRVSDFCTSPGAIRDTLRFCYYRDSIKTLSHDIETLGEDLLLIVDSFQKLPSKINHHRESLENWLHKFEEIKKRGVSIIILSEVDKATYKAGRTPSLGDYKETGEIEYSVDTGLQLRTSRYSPELVELWVVKCRARPFTGKLVLIRRESFGKFSEEDGKRTQPQSQEYSEDGWDSTGKEW